MTLSELLTTIANDTAAKCCIDFDLNHSNAKKMNSEYAIESNRQGDNRIKAVYVGFLIDEFGKIKKALIERIERQDKKKAGN